MAKNKIYNNNKTIYIPKNFHYIHQVCVRFFFSSKKDQVHLAVSACVNYLNVCLFA